MTQYVPKAQQAYGAFNGGEIIENKPIGFHREGGSLKAYSSLFYWAHATATVDSTIGLHPHQGFEILSFVLEGSIKHYDTQLDTWQALAAGDVQIIRAGNGISHSESMAAGSRLFQIWLDPDLSVTMSQAASYDDYKSSSFLRSTINDQLTVTHYAGNKGIIQLDTPSVQIEKWTISTSTALNIPLVRDQTYSIYSLEGSITIDDAIMETDDFLVIKESSQVKLHGNGQIFIIASPTILNYATYSLLMQERMGRQGL